MTNNHKQYARSLTHRRVTAFFGVFFIALAVLIIIVSDITLWSVSTAVVIGLLGVDALLSAIRKTSSLLSRIGPLP